eukprot:COSAG02_NODE_894_length_16133_cov_5.336036_9_plen_86_part_00
MEKDSLLNVFSWSGFTSCTVDPAVGLCFVDRYNCNAFFRIHSGGRRLRPVKIDQWSQFPYEQEVLFDVSVQYALCSRVLRAIADA